MHLNSSDSIEFPYLPENRNEHLIMPLSDIEYSKVKKNALISKSKKFSPSTRITPPSGVTEKLRPSPDDFVYQPVNSKWRAMKCKEVLDNQVNFPLHIDINDIDSRFDLRKSIVKCKIPIIPDGNCLFRALSWWLSGNEDIHQLVRQKLINFMRSPLSERYIVVKTDQKVEKYPTQKKMEMPTIWGGDVELFCAARLADTLCPPEAPFGSLGSHWLIIREITSLNTFVILL